MEHQKLQGLMTNAERMARVASAGLLAAQAKQTAPSGAISLDNADGTRTIIGEVVNGESNPSYTMATHVGDETPPGIPTGITATSKSGVVVVEWDGTLSGGIPDDFFCVRIYLDNVELGALTEAGSVASAKLDGGTTVSITATSEDDCCLPDGTPDHNVSQASQAISVTVTSSAEEIVVEVEEEIEGVQREITDFKREVAADYYKSEYINDNFSTKTEVGAVYRDSMARNLSPFYSHDFEDVSTTDSEAYWHTLTTAKTEQLSDGWAHVTLDNSAGTSNLYAYAAVRAPFLPIVAGTLMVEIRNVQVTAAGRWGIGRTPQGLTFPQLDVTEDGTYYRPCTVNNPDPANGVAMSLRFYALAGVSVEFDARLSYYEGEYSGKYRQYNADTANLTREYATKTWTEQTAEDISIAAAQKYTATIGNQNLNPFFAHDFLDIYNATTNPGGWWRGSVQRDFATQLQDGWARVVIDNTSGTETLAKAFRFGATPDLKDGGKYTCLVEMRNILSKPTSANIYTQQGTDVQFWGDRRYDGWTIAWGDVPATGYVEHKQMKRVEAVSRQTTGTCCFSMNVQVPAGQKADFEMRLSLYENATDSEGETIPYAGNFKPYVTDQQALSKEYATQSQLTVGIDGIRTEVSQTYETKNHAGLTYANKTTTEQTFTELDTRVTSNATNIEGEILARETLIRQYANGVLVCKVGESVGALVNASGSFDVVSVSWSGNEPTVTGTLSTMTDSYVSLMSDQVTLAYTGEGGATVMNPDGKIALVGSVGSRAGEVWDGFSVNPKGSDPRTSEVCGSVLRVGVTTYDPVLHYPTKGTVDFPMLDFANAVNLVPVELFSGSTAGTVTLSETAANFDRLVIYYEAGGSGAGSVEVSSPNGKQFSMQGMYFASSANIVQQRFKVMSISGTSITRVSSGYVNTSTAGAVSVDTSENNIEVKRVLGYRPLINLGA